MQQVPLVALSVPKYTNAPARSPRWRTAVCLILVSLLACRANAVSVETRVDATLEDFDKGKTFDLAMGGEGSLRLAPASECITRLKEACIWAIVEDSKGNLYIGTGNRGIIYRLQPDGQMSEYHRSSAMHVLSLAVDAKDRLYAGTAPQGQILRIDADGLPSIFYETGAAYVWALCFDAQGHLWAATGKDAAIMRLDQDGREVWRYKPPARHVLCLAFDRKGLLYAGTAGQKGAIYRVEQGDRVTTLFEASQPEIHALALDDGERVYAATASAMPPPAPPEPAISGQTPRAGEEPPTGVPGSAPPAQPGTVPGAPPPARENVVYRLDPGTGLVETLFGISGMSFYSLAWHDKRVYVGSGSRGWLFIVDRDGIQAAVSRPERELISLAVTPKRGLMLGTANGASLVRILPRLAEKGEYLSHVLDGRSQCRWGQIRWTATVPEGTSLTVQTRSGNTAEPDDTWSAWQLVQTDKTGLGDGGHITSPAARCLQYKVQMTTTKNEVTPVLEAVHITYQPRNLPPRIKRFDVGSAGVSGSRTEAGAEGRPPAKAQSTTSGAESQVVRGRLQLSWQAEDPNGDTLRYDLYARSDEETVWKKVAEKLKDTRFEWKTEAVPDGRYRLLLRVTDLPSNAIEEAFWTEAESKPMVVDNTPPVFTGLRHEWDPLRRCRVRGRVEDAMTRIARIEFALDGEEWFAAQAADGVLDSNAEEFNIITPPLHGREHSVVIRALDAAGNAALTRVVVRPAGG